jgi:hypothetical protein
MNRPTVLVLTDLSNGDADEDILLGECLRENFRIYVVHPMDSEDLEQKVDAIIIRNVWNTGRYGQPEPWYDRWRRIISLPIHDDLYVRKGSEKDYLLELYARGYPVIPTVDSIGDIGTLPPSDSYFIKPKDGFDAINARKVSISELMKLRPTGYLIQPFIEFEHECSFYYLDGELQYALYAPLKEKRWDMVEFFPSKEDLAFAGGIVSWGRQRHGIVRIDACRLSGGKLLLMEITDQGGVYLSLSCLTARSQRVFLRRLVASLEKLVRRNKAASRLAA